MKSHGLEWLNAYKPSVFFRKVETVEDAGKILKEIAVGFYGLAALLIVLGLLVAILRPSITDGIVFLILGFCLQRFKSRTAAVLAVLLAIGSILVTASNMVTRQGGTNILLALIVLMFSIRSVQASFAYHRLRRVS